VEIGRGLSQAPCRAGHKKPVRMCVYEVRMQCMVHFFDSMMFIDKRITGEMAHAVRYPVRLAFW